MSVSYSTLREDRSRSLIIRIMQGSSRMPYRDQYECIIFNIATSEFLNFKPLIGGDTPGFSMIFLFNPAPCDVGSCHVETRPLSSKRAKE